MGLALSHLFCSIYLSSKTTVKAIGWANSVRKEDCVELNSSLTLCACTLPIYSQMEILWDNYICYMHAYTYRYVHIPGLVITLVEFSDPHWLIITPYTHQSLAGNIRSPLACIHWLGTDWSLWYQSHNDVFWHWHCIVSDSLILFDNCAPLGKNR